MFDLTLATEWWRTGGRVFRMSRHLHTWKYEAMAKQLLHKARWIRNEQGDFVPPPFKGGSCTDAQIGKRLLPSYVMH